MFPVRLLCVHTLDPFIVQKFDITCQLQSVVYCLSWSPYTCSIMACAGQNVCSQKQDTDKGTFPCRILTDPPPPNVVLRNILLKQSPVCYRVVENHMSGLKQSHLVVLAVLCMNQFSVGDKEFRAFLHVSANLLLASSSLNCSANISFK